MFVSSAVSILVLVLFDLRVHNVRRMPCAVIWSIYAAGATDIFGMIEMFVAFICVAFSRCHDMCYEKLCEYEYFTCFCSFCRLMPFAPSLEDAPYIKIFISCFSCFVAIYPLLNENGLFLNGSKTHKLSQNDSNEWRPSLVCSLHFVFIQIRCSIWCVKYFSPKKMCCLSESSLQAYKSQWHLLNYCSRTHYVQSGISLFFSPAFSHNSIKMNWLLCFTFHSLVAQHTHTIYE